MCAPHFGTCREETIIIGVYERVTVLVSSAIKILSVTNLLRASSSYFLDALVLVLMLYIGRSYIPAAAACVGATGAAAYRLLIYNQI